ncbi:MAG: uroporphyrinogen-III synthase [Sphingorhabdus sp.]
MKLLVIRPQPGADATAARVRALDHEAVIMPLFEVRPVAWEVPTPNAYDALLLTSGNAVRQAGAGLDRLRGLPVYAVGSATKRAAEQLNLVVAITGDAGVDALLAVADAGGHRRLLWLAGEDRMALSLPEGVMIDTRIVYRSVALATPADFAATVTASDVILLHSARAAKYFTSFCEIQALDRANITVAALSSAIAESAGSGWRERITAPTPNDAALLSQVQSCFTKSASDP